MHPVLLFTTAHGDVTSLIQNEHVVAGIITATVFIVMLVWVPALTMLFNMIRRETRWHGPLVKKRAGCEPS